MLVLERKRGKLRLESRASRVQTRIDGRDAGEMVLDVRTDTDSDEG